MNLVSIGVEKENRRNPLNAPLVRHLLAFLLICIQSYWHYLRQKLVHLRIREGFLFEPFARSSPGRPKVQHYESVALLRFFKRTLERVSELYLRRHFSG